MAKTSNVRALASAAFLPAMAASAQAGPVAPLSGIGSPGLPLVAVQSCGWYVILGCHNRHADAAALVEELGGPFAGGGAGLHVLHTDDYPNFRDGYFCVGDGPYGSHGDAASIAWTEARAALAAAPGPGALEFALAIRAFLHYMRRSIALGACANGPRWTTSWPWATFPD